MVKADIIVTFKSSLTVRNTQRLSSSLRAQSLKENCGPVICERYFKLRVYAVITALSEPAIFSTSRLNTVLAS
uniref:Uncharacterized protein n=1 Tax=Yersinia enterocolitica TaxID=630 RepID=B0RKL8_YEREN|nr:hypothetical protein [Yersinia enterocolitica]